MFIKLHYFVIKKNNRTCITSLWKAWGARHIFRIITIFYIENFFYCILLEKHQFFRFQNFEDSFLEIFKYHIEKKYVSIIFEDRMRENIFISKKKNLGCKLRMEWPIYFSSTKGYHNTTKWQKWIKIQMYMDWNISFW